LEDPVMSPDKRQRPDWLRLGPMPAAGGGSLERPAGGLDVAWRFWEHLRGWDRRYAFVVDTVLAVGLFLVGSGWFFLREHPRPNVAMVAGLTLPLIFRRRTPIGVFAVVSIVALVQYLVFNNPTVADAALLLALYTVTVDSHWMQAAVASVVLEIGVILATVHWVPTGNHIKGFVFLSGLAFAALLAGVVVRALRNQMEWLAERAQRLELERDQQASLAAAAERARIAREMHDVVSHNIQVMVTLADAAGAARASDSEHAAEAMREVSGTGRQALGDMRRMLGVLRDGNRTNADALPLAPQPGLGDLDALIDRVRSTGLTVSVEESGRRFALSEAAELTVFRIVQEALTNALKHAAEPSAVVIAITYDDPEVSVLVTDDGAGDQQLNGTGGGHGVAGMAERAAAFGGSLRAGPHNDGGWQVEATLRGCKAPARA
jgi:signal transduction histidine kinase